MAAVSTATRRLRTDIAVTSPSSSKPLAPIEQFKQEVSLREDHLRKLLPEHIKPERFVSELVMTAAANPDLLEVPRETLIRAAYEAAELGLSLNPAMRECDILPQWNGRRKRKEAVFRPRYMGYMKLARQSGEISKVYAHVVYDCDVFYQKLGTDKRLDHEPAEFRPPEAKKRGVYCVWHFRDGTGFDFEYMTAADVEGVRDRSESFKAGKGSPWTSDEDEMWRKTVVRRASKYMPLAADNDPFRKAVALDDAREVGKAAEIRDDGLVWVDDAPVDITAPANAQPKRTGSMEALKQRIAAAKPAELPDDLDAWARRITDEAHAMQTTDDVLAYAETLKPQLAALDLVRPEMADEMRQMLDRAAEGVVE